MAENSLLPQNQTQAKEPQSGAQIDKKLDAEYGLNTSDVLANATRSIVQFTTDDAQTDWRPGDFSAPVGQVGGDVLELTLTQDNLITASTNISIDQSDGLYRSSFLRVIQDGTGGHTLTFASQFKFAGGTPPVLSEGAGDEHILEFVKTGNNEMLHVGSQLDIS